MAEINMVAWSAGEAFISPARFFATKKRDISHTYSLNKWGVQNDIFSSLGIGNNSLKNLPHGYKAYQFCSGRTLILNNYKP